MHEDEMDDDELVVDCGTQGCLMPGLHFRSECHTVDTADISSLIGGFAVATDIIQLMDEYEQKNGDSPAFINSTPRPWA